MISFALRTGKGLRLLAVMSLVVFFCVDVSAQAPTPGPSLESERSHGYSRNNVVKYSLGDITKSLLNFGGKNESDDVIGSALVPIPPLKPILASSGPLNQGDIKTYARVFTLVEQGQFDDVDKALERTGNKSLKGHVLYQKYMHPNYKTSFEELNSWLARYADHPGADKIYALAQKRQPEKFSGTLPIPQKAGGVAIVNDPTLYVSKKSDRSGSAREASRYLYQGHIDKAKSSAYEILKAQPKDVSKATWVLGLAYWLEGDYKPAAKNFERVARSEYTSGWLSSAGGYWAARAHMRSGNVARVSHWLKHASQYEHSFYGLLATRALKNDFGFNWAVPSLSAGDIALIKKTRAGARALDLEKIGQHQKAEQELTTINAGRDKKLRDALVAYALNKSMPSLAMRLGAYSFGIEGKGYDAALYPKGPWDDGDVLRGDARKSALVHAIMRQESRFNPHAKSAQGAMGLMQIMPVTARAMSGKSEPDLLKPAQNLKIGQKYIHYLLERDVVGGDLVSLLIAYNAGPGNLAKWRERWSDIDDPLLFVELIPAGETRGYVERVLASYWIYNLREQIMPETMDAMIKAEPVKYASDQRDEPNSVVALAEHR